MTTFISQRHRPIAMATAALVCVALSAVTLAQDDAFRRGVSARNDKQWPAAAAAMREAIKVRSQESKDKVGARPIIGGGTEYLPHFFLGEALFNTNDCAGAINEWAISEQQGAIESRADLLKILRNGYAECDKRGVLLPGKFEPLATRVNQQYTEVHGLAQKVSTLGEQNVDVWRADASMREQYERAAGELQTASTRLQSGRTSRLQRDLAEATAATERARAILVTIEASLTAAIDGRRTAQSLLRDVQDAITAAETLNNSIAAKKGIAFTPAMTTAHQEGRDGIGRARERLIEGTKTLSPQTLASARTVANEASTKLKLLLDEIGRLEKDVILRNIAEAITKANDSFSLLDSVVATLDRFAVERPNLMSPDKVAEREAAQKLATQARRRLDAARRAESVPGIDEAARLAAEARDRFNLIIGTFGPLSLRDRGVHAMLEQGAREYFNGEYQQAVSSLAPANIPADAALRVHVHVFRAAALYQLFLKTGGKDDALRTQAVAEVEHGKAVDSAFVPNSAFSPRFVAFYQSVPPPPAAVPEAAPEPAPQP